LLQAASTSTSTDTATTSRPNLGLAVIIPPPSWIGSLDPTPPAAHGSAIASRGPTLPRFLQG
jgi:hypothetical protein